MARLTLYRPVKPLVIVQRFGENKACIRFDGKVISAQNGVCPSGSEPFYPSVGLKGHNGLDIIAWRGVPIYNAQEGYVKELSFDVERGLGVGIITKDKYEFAGGGYYAKLRYWHLLSISVKAGQFVGVGDLIGFSDNTGNSSGDHLHFEVKPVTINTELTEHATSHDNVFPKNGYTGAIDPEPYLDALYAIDAKPIIFKLQNVIAQLAIKVAELLAKKK